MQNRLLSLDSNEKIPFCLLCFSEFMQFYKLALCDVTKDIDTSPKLPEAFFFSEHNSVITIGAKRMRNALLTYHKVYNNKQC